MINILKLHFQKNQTQKFRKGVLGEGENWASSTWIYVPAEVEQKSQDNGQQHKRPPPGEAPRPSGSDNDVKDGDAAADEDEGEEDGKKPEKPSLPPKPGKPEGPPQEGDEEKPPTP